MLPADGRKDRTEAWVRKERAPERITVEIRTWRFRHSWFLQDSDVAQRLYEKARKAAIDGRVHVSEALCQTLRSHGVSGIFIDPENIILSCSHRRSSPRRGTAFHHTHLREEVFQTIATSLAEGVGVSTTARIQNVDKKTVLLVLEEAAEHAEKVNRLLLHPA